MHNFFTAGLGAGTGWYFIQGRLQGGHLLVVLQLGSNFSIVLDQAWLDNSSSQENARYAVVVYSGDLQSRTELIDFKTLNRVTINTMLHLQISGLPENLASMTTVTLMWGYLGNKTLFYVWEILLDQKKHII